jgi:hypothetical protein
MLPERFAEIAATIASSGEQTRRALARSALVATLLATLGLAASDDETAAHTGCNEECQKKKSGKKRRKCRRKCERREFKPVAQTGSATLTLLSAPDCQIADLCTDQVQGEITGTPIAEGAFAGELTGTNFRPGPEPDTTDIDYAGTLTATETGSGESLSVEVEIALTLNDTTGDFTFAGTFEIAGGTGRFDGAAGDGTLSGNGARALDGLSGAIDAFTMTGEIDFH